jgi:hypothetical protein
MEATMTSTPPRHGSARAVEIAERVDVERPPHLAVRKIEQWTIESDAGVVDPGVDPSELTLRGRGEALGIGGIRHLRRHRDGRNPVGAATLGGLLQPPTVPRRQHEPGAPLRQQHGRRFPNAARRTGDHHHRLVKRPTQGHETRPRAPCQSFG